MGDPAGELPASGLWAAIGRLRPGNVLGRYELLLPIARGGMAVVWAARDSSDTEHPLFAVKTALPSLSDDTRYSKMFAEETRIASQIRHPNVCAVLDHGRALELDYLVMEWIDGEPLSALVTEGVHLPWGVACRIALDAAEGLRAAHALSDDAGRSLGIVHRDVSPQNILLGMNGVAKIADFGVAKATQAASHSTRSGLIKGKVDYLSPEQAFSEPLDCRADVFALGAVLYEITTGKKPFLADSQMATLVKLTSAEPVEPPEDVVTGYPEALSTVVSRALEKNREARYPSMEAFARELSEALRALDANRHADVAAYLRSVCSERIARRTRAIQRAMASPATSDAKAPATDRGESLQPKALVEAARPRRIQRGHWARLSLAGLAVSGLVAASLALFQGVSESDARAAPADMVRAPNAPSPPPVVSGQVTGAHAPPEPAPVASSQPAQRKTVSAPLRSVPRRPRPPPEPEEDALLRSRD